MSTPSTERKRGRRNLVVGVILILLALVTVVQLVVVNLSLANSTQCQAQINAHVSLALSYRAKLADDDRQNTYELVSSIANATTREEVAAALHNYLTRKAQIDKEISKIHIPDAEEVGRCGS